MKHRTVARLSLILGIVSFLAIITFLLISKRPPEKIAVPFSSREESDRHVMRGIRYSANLREEMTLSLEAEEIRLGKKKLGFLRFGLLNEALLTNVKIRIMREQGRTKEETGAKGSLRTSISLREEGLGALKKPAEEIKGVIVESARAILDEMGDSKVLHGVSKSGVVSVKIAPIEFQICEADSTVVRISAGRASLEMKDRNIVFRENVQFIIFEQSWTGEELVIDLDSGTVTCGGEREGTNAERLMNGRELQIDKNEISVHGKRVRDQRG